MNLSTCLSTSLTIWRLKIFNLMRVNNNKATRLIHLNTIKIALILFFVLLLSTNTSAEIVRVDDKKTVQMFGKECYRAARGIVKRVRSTYYLENRFKHWGLEADKELQGVNAKSLIEVSTKIGTAGLKGPKFYFSCIFNDITTYKWKNPSSPNLIVWNYTDGTGGKCWHLKNRKYSLGREYIGQGTFNPCK